MNPNYVHTVTLYRRRPDGTYMKNILEGCFWKANTVSVQQGTNVSMQNAYTVRIPSGLMPEGLTVSLNNDIVVLGACLDEISNAAGYRAAEVLARHKPAAFKVTAFSDNTGHLIDKHYRLGG